MERKRIGYKISSLNLMGKTPISNAHRKLLPLGQHDKGAKMNITPICCLGYYEWALRPHAYTPSRRNF
jgi:hypothetical protein